jgi:hypothetical protein
MGAKPRGAMKVTHTIYRMVTQCGPVAAACSAAETELQLRDPKGDELDVARPKSEETLMEGRRGSNVQIDLQSCV